MSKISERIVNAERVEDLIAVFGSFDENIKHSEGVFLYLEKLLTSLI